MAITVKLPRKIKGNELIKVIEDSLASLGYQTSTDLREAHYEPGSVKLKETEKTISGLKSERIALSLGDKLLFATTPIGWLIYALETPERHNMTSPRYFKSTSIVTDISLDEDYDDVGFKVNKNEHSVDAKDIVLHTSIKEEFEKLVKSIYLKLGYAP